MRAGLSAEQRTTQVEAPLMAFPLESIRNGPGWAASVLMAWAQSAGLLEVVGHQSEPFESGQGAHLLVDLLHQFAAEFRGEEDREESFDLFRALDAGADGDPVELQQLASQNA